MMQTVFYEYKVGQKTESALDVEYANNTKFSREIEFTRSVKKNLVVTTFVYNPTIAPISKQTFMSFEGSELRRQDY